MATGDFLTKEEEGRLVKEIADIERRTSGEIRIHLAKKVSSAGPIADAAHAFHKLGMNQTAARNGVLIFVATKDHKLACIGDRGIHAKIGDQGWKHVVATMSESFKKGDYFVGLHQAVEQVGQVLIEHFPQSGGDNANELPDDISSD